jgi:hypothetical protein
MDVFEPVELLSEHPLDYYSQYDAGFAHGIVSAWIVVLFLWSVVSAFNRK